MANVHENPEDLVKKNIGKALWGAAIFFVVMVILGIHFEPQIEKHIQQLYEKMGLLGLSLFVFLNDTLISPLPGDVAVIIVSKSSLREHW